MGTNTYIVNMTMFITIICYEFVTKITPYYSRRTFVIPIICNKTIKLFFFNYFHKYTWHLGQTFCLILKNFVHLEHLTTLNVCCITPYGRFSTT